MWDLNRVRKIHTMDFAQLTELSLDKLLNGGGIQEPVTPKPVNTGKSQQQLKNSRTLESLHSVNIQKIRDEKQQLPALKNQLADKKADFQKIEQKFMGPILVSNSAEIAILTGRDRMEAEIRDLEAKIRSIESGESEADYFLRVGEILFSYTDAQNRIAAGQKAVEVAPKKQRMPANSVYSYFAAATAAAATAAEAEAAVLPTGDEDEPTPNEFVLPSYSNSRDVKKASNVESDMGFRRDKALESYMAALDPNNVNHDTAVISTLEENYGNCPVCDTEMFFNETFLDCSDCGFREYILVDSEKPSYKDPPREMSYYAYKKINHLNEWLAQFQAKETTEIPQSVLEQIRTELRKERITDMSKLKASKLKEVLKKLKLSRCYDHVAHILNRLNGISAPVLSREVEERLRYMFKEIQFSFVKHCPKKRSNFLSYSYVLYKFCELLGLDEYLPCFPLLKSREKLYMQDKIWQLICLDMGWEFHRTV